MPDERGMPSREAGSARTGSHRPPTGLAGRTASGSTQYTDDLGQAPAGYSGSVATTDGQHAVAGRAYGQRGADPWIAEHSAVACHAGAPSSADHGLRAVCSSSSVSTLVGGRDSYAGGVAAAPPRGEPRANVPQLLRLETPNGHMSCTGEYALVPGEQANGYPLWKQKGGDRWLYSGSDGKWHIDGRDARDRGFDCATGVIHSLSVHLGMMPDAVGAGRWLRKYGAETLDDPAIRITAVRDSTVPTWCNATLARLE